ncbi:PDZ domain-containing protein [Bacillus xiapuensis]|uniref:PDZ domain-containing protein n=1 Tax=Bacillus xiapuensis TaxID=2014075 RepID=UPI000C244C56|nr:PDZ domain-containing protein [Bacillus xiapuensis]
MVQDWLIGLLAGLGKLLIHPLLYFSLMLAFVVGMLRVNRERKDFDTCVHDIYQEIRGLFPFGLLLGLAVSAVTLLAGLTVPVETLNFVAAATVILSIGGFRFLSPAWTIGLVFFLLLLSETNGWAFIPHGGLSLSGLLQTLAVLAALLVIAEGLLILNRGWQDPSPRLVKSPRGLKMGVQLAQRLWLVPVFLVLPAGDLEAPQSWWPMISIGAESYALVCFPFLIGFAQLVKSTLPKLAVKATGKGVIAAGATALLLAAAAYWLPFLAIVSMLFVIGSRIWISWRHYSYERARHYFFTPQPKGMMILGVIPYSPASKMGLELGEIIYKVNGTPVQSEIEFYEALQRNAAYCKLEVVDVNGQLRFVQGSLYEGEHHELGLILAVEEKKFEDVEKLL